MHCQWQLVQLQEAIPELEEMGYFVAAIGSRNADRSLSRYEDGSISLLSDTDRKLGEALGIAFGEDDDEFMHYKENAFGAYGPAVYVVNQQGIIEYDLKESLHSDPARCDKDELQMVECR